MSRVMNRAPTSPITEIAKNPVSILLKKTCLSEIQPLMSGGYFKFHYGYDTTSFYLGLLVVVSPECPS